MNELELLLGQVYSGGGSGGSGGTTNYNALSNKPSIGGVTLSGNKTADDLGLCSDETIGNLANLTTAIKTNIVAAINELDGDVGDLPTLTTTIKTSIVNAINEHDTEIGDLSTLTTAAKAALVSAINELDSEIGVLSTLTTTAKSTLVAAINELDGEIGNLTSLTTAHKSTIVGAVNELDSDIGDKSTLKTSAKTNVVAAVNELHDNVLEKDNTTAFTPDADYEPATKKYVDDGDAAIETEIAAVANAGAKNIFPRLASATKSGITAVVHDDGSVTLNGTSTGLVQINTGYYVIPQGVYTLSSGVAADKRADVHTYVNAGNAAGSYVKPLGSTATQDNVQITINYNGYAKVVVGILVPQGKTLNNITVYPMLRDAAIKDDTYVPYAMSNLELTAKKQDAGKYLAADISNTNLWYTGDEAKLFAAVRSSNYMHIAFRNLPNAEQPATPITEWVQWNGDAMEWRKNDHNGDALLGRWTADEDTGWQSLAGMTTVAYKRRNGNVILKFAQGVNPLSQSNDIATLPAGFRPSSTMFFDFNIWVNAGGWKGYPIIVEIQSTGLIRFTQVPTEAQNGTSASVVCRSTLTIPLG